MWTKILCCLQHISNTVAHLIDSCLVLKTIVVHHRTNLKTKTMATNIGVHFKLSILILCVGVVGGGGGVALSKRT